MKPSKINTCLENKPKKNMVLQQLSPVPTGPFLNLVFSAGNLDSARAAPRHLRCGRRSGRRPLGGLSLARASIKTLSWRWCQMTFFFPPRLHLKAVPTHLFNQKTGQVLFRFFLKTWGWGGFDF